MRVKPVVLLAVASAVALAAVCASGPSGHVAAPAGKDGGGKAMHAQRINPAADPTLLDVNDVAFLWPAPKTKDDVNGLISLADMLADGKSALLPKDAFNILLDSALSIRLPNSGGQIKQINFAQFAAQFRDAKNWKIAAIRIDPSAPGTDPSIIKEFGSIPQIRCIAQPVTLQQGAVKIHDTTAHLVFSFVANKSVPFQPDSKKFADIVSDVRALKVFLKAKEVTTAGPLGVHPGFAKGVPGFSEKVKSLLRKHLSADRLSAMAFMGISPPEPWVFLSLDQSSGKWALSKNPIISGVAQMLIMSGGDAVSPKPLPLNIDRKEKKGCSTFPLFAQNIGAQLDRAIFADMPDLKFKDIPDYVANPARADFFTTDCVSCHSESTRRTALGLDAYASPFRYARPAGISGLDQAVVNRKVWNVRNFGWGDTTGVPTVTQRTANEAAASADFINKKYRGNAMTSVSHPLTLVMTIKGDKELNELKQLLGGMESAPVNPISAALEKIGTVHFARFVLLDNRHLAVITTFDNDFDEYIDSFVDAIGTVFDELLQRMEGAPPLPVSDHRKEFLDYIKRNDRQPLSFYSAYPNLRVGEILTFEKNQQGP